MKRWSDKEITILKELWKTKETGLEIARRLGRTRKAVFEKARKLKLPIKENPQKIELSLSDRLWFLHNYPHMRNDLCAMKLGISHTSCTRLAKKFGIAKTKEFMSQCSIFGMKKSHEKQLLNGTYPQKGVLTPNLAKGACHRFKPGHSKNSHN